PEFGRHKATAGACAPDTGEPAEPSRPLAAPAKPFRIERDAPGKRGRAGAQRLSLGRGQRCATNLGSTIAAVAHAKKWTVAMVIIISQRDPETVSIAAQIA